MIKILRESQENPFDGMDISPFEKSYYKTGFKGYNQILCEIADDYTIFRVVISQLEENGNTFAVFAGTLYDDYNLGTQADTYVKEVDGAENALKVGKDIIDKINNVRTEMEAKEIIKNLDGFRKIR